MKTDRLRWLWVVLYAVGSGLLLFCGWFLPVHLRATDAPVLQRAGEQQPSLVDRGITLARANNPEAARLILQAAQAEDIPGTDALASAVATRSPNNFLFPGGPTVNPATPITALVIQSENRERILAYLKATGSPAVQELLRARDVTNTVLFSPSSSPSGQAIDAAISICGLLLAGNHLMPGLRDAVLERSTSAASRADPQPLEEILMNFISLGQRLNWGQLTAFVSDINDPATLSTFAERARNAGSQLPQLFAAVTLSRRPDAVAAYLTEFNDSGLNDLGASLHYGKGGLDELLQRRQRLYVSTEPRVLGSGLGGWYVRVTSAFALRAPSRRWC